MDLEGITLNEITQREEDKYLYAESQKAELIERESRMVDARV